MARPPSSPPALSGFDHVRLLGSGGFADVFLYQQQHPRRQVAVKVLLKERLGSDTVTSFTEEANLMAQFASHPSIVSVYQAGVSDDGRPYLVMEHCSKPNLQVRHRRERFSEAETLRIGVQIAGAVETAHRAGILHRDIKPANILVTDYGRPALTDFGISATTTGEMTGMSIPWSPPEAFRSPPQGFPASDVYSLAATLYTLLSNRSPFEVPGASNTELDVMARIQSMPLPTVGRSDVSAAFQAVLERAMAKDPDARYATAVEFARALQRVQREHGMPATQIDVVEEDLIDDDDVDDDGEERTRFRGVTSIDAQATHGDTARGTLPSVPPGVEPLFQQPNVGPASGGMPDTTVARGSSVSSPVSPGAPASPAASASSAATLPPVSNAPAAIGGPPAAPPLETTIVRGPASAVVTETAVSRAPRRGRRAAWIVGAGGFALVAAIVVLALTLSPSGVGTPSDDVATAAPVDPVVEAPTPQIQDLSGRESADGVVFTWTNPDPQDGDSYLWRPVVPGEDFSFEETTAETATVTADASGRACVEVVLRRADGSAAADSTQGCAP